MNNIIGGDGFPAIRRIATAAAICWCTAAGAQVDIQSYLWQTFRYQYDASMPQQVVEKLRWEVDRILAAGHLAPLRISGADIDTEGYWQYFEPGRIILTLAMAYPYLASAQQALVRVYVNNELSNAAWTPWSSTRVLDAANGARREPFSMSRMWQWSASEYGSYPRVFTLYGLWLYAYHTGDWSVIQSNWNAIKASYTINRAEARLYGQMGAHIAMARMAHRQNDTAMVTTATNNLAADMAQSFATVDGLQQTYFARHFQAGMGARGMVHCYMFYNLPPEIGRYILDNSSITSQCIARHQSLTNAFRFWHTHRPWYGTGWTGHESRGLPSALIGMAMPMERWVMQRSTGTLAGYKIHSAPIWTGDSYTIEAMVLTLSAFGPQQWVDVRSTAPVNVPPTCTLTSPVNNSTYTAPATVNLAATASDSDGSVVSVAFYQGTTVLFTDTDSPYSYTWSGVSSGTYQLRAMAMDNQGATGMSAVVTITVVSTEPPLNRSPVVTMTSPVNNSTHTAPATLNLAATATDPDGTIANVRFYRGTTLFATDTASPYEYIWVNVSSGTYQLRAVATDNQGATSTSTVVTVTVLSSSTPPVWYTLTTAVNPANSGTVSPASGTYLAGSQIQVTATPNTNYTFAGWSGDASGTNPTITLTMDSNKSITANFTYVPPANSSPTVSITSPNDGATYTAPASITITATATDTDGTITVVRFYSGATLLGADSTSPYSYTWTGVSAGSYVLTAQAEDNQGAVGTSGAVGITVSAQPVYYTLTVTANPSNGGTVNQTPSGTSHLAGTQVSLTATPNAGYEFAGWTGDITGSSTTNPTVVVMDANKTLTANFQQLQSPQPALNPGEVRIVGGQDGYINATQNPNVTIRFRRTIAGAVTVRIYDLRGRLVMERAKDGQIGIDDDIAWNAEAVAGGVYLVRVQGAGVDAMLKTAVRR